MEPALREIAKKMGRRLTAQTEFGPHSKGEAAHFANAAARVLRALTAHQLKRCATQSGANRSAICFPC